jgi:GT2 family glycosyltransferase
MSEITAVLVTHRRPDNIQQIVDALKQQTVEPDLILINNWDMAAYQVERAAFVPWNAGPVMRHVFATYAETEWVMALDDDLRPADAEFVEDALRLAKKRPGVITCAFGRHLGQSEPYYRPRNEFGRVAIALGRMMIFRRELLDNVGLPPMRFPWAFRSDDIWLSLEVGRGKPVHWADMGLSKRLVDMPEGGPEVALSLQKEHSAGREEACRWWLENRQ